MRECGSLGPYREMLLDVHSDVGDAGRRETVPQDLEADLDHR